MKPRECQHTGIPTIEKARVNGVIVIISRCPKCGEEIGRKVEGE
jgi:hypothetical protein